MGAKENILAVLSERPTGLLYHYTNGTGLFGIFRDKAIWASSAYHLNDSNEFRYAIQLIKEELINRIRGEKDARNETYSDLLKELDNFQSGIQVFVASFSEEGDLLSQWLSYGNRLNGYAIGMRRAHFRPALSNEFSLMRCRYTEEEHAHLVGDVIDILCEISPNNKNSDALIPLAFAGLSAIKHSGF
ncbi:MAG: hypothetical protein ABI147_07025 [Acidobacteriaceae bacterium]